MCSKTVQKAMKTNYLVWATFAVKNQHPTNNVLKTQKVSIRPDVAASFFWFLKKTKKRYNVQRDGWCVIGEVCAKKKDYNLILKL